MILDELINAVVPYIIHSLELIGIFIIVESAIRVFIKYIKGIKNPNKTPLKIEFAESVAFALDFKLASEIIKTVVIRSMNELYVLGAVVALRVVLTLVLQWEIKAGISQSQNTQSKNGQSQQKNGN
jgi:uncharacterized membrane protein